MSGNSRVIFSVYKEVNDNSVTDYKKQQFKDYKDRLIKRQHNYAKLCNADYFVYENNNQITDEYNSIQFFKIQQLEILANKYDEILYLDLDVIPFIFVNFFEKHDMNKLCCFHQNGKEWGLKRYFRKWEIYNHLKVLDSQSWWVKACAKNAMLLLENHSNFNDMIINTGVLGGNSHVIKQIKFTENLNKMIELLHQAKQDNVYQKEISDNMVPNNEVFLSYLVEKNKIPMNYIDENYNYVLDDVRKVFRDWEQMFFIHVINKDFETLNKIYNLF